MATAQSFVIAGIMLSVLALPLVFGATRESLTQVPPRLREASFALGKTRATTIRRVLLPSIRPGMASGVVLGMGRIIGDTAILMILLGSTLRNEPVGHVPIYSTLRGVGSTLTSYVYNNSPAGEGGSPNKAYAAAFVLLMIVVALNAIVTRLTMGRETGRGRRRGPGLRLARWIRDALTPPPVRRIVLDREPSVAPPRAAPNGAAPVSAGPRLRAASPAPALVRQRMSIESVWLAYGENWVVRDVSLPVRQGEVLAMIGASGSGKTTLLRSLNRLTEITAGAGAPGG